MSGKSKRMTAEEWFQQKCDQLGINPDDLVHPGDVDHEDAEWLIGARVLHFDSAMGTADSMRRDDFEVQEIQDVPTAGGEEQSFAIYYYKMGNPAGMNIEASREELEKWDRQVRFVPEDVEVRTQDAESAIERLRDMPSGTDLYGSQAEDLAEALGADFDRESLHEDSIPVPLFLKRMVSNLTDESPISASDYFGRSITGHKKSARGEYKGNLAILEDHFGMEVSYGRNMDEELSS